MFFSGLSIDMSVPLCGVECVCRAEGSRTGLGAVIEDRLSGLKRTRLVEVRC